MPIKQSKIEKAIQDAMPGWKVVKRRPEADNSTGITAHTTADAISPGLAAQRVKAGVVNSTVAKKSAYKKKGHAVFVTVAPSSQPDTIRKFQKVVLVKNGKVVAQQG